MNNTIKKGTLVKKRFSRRENHDYDFGIVIFVKIANISDFKIANEGLRYLVVYWNFNLNGKENYLTSSLDIEHCNRIYHPNIKFFEAPEGIAS